MPKLNCHIALFHNLDLVQLKPGDELPKWAVGLVGDHCFDGETKEPEEVAEETAETEEVEESEGATEEVAAEEPEEVAEATPDFTKPATRRGRPRAKKA